jgi:hypothetical protein
MTEYNERGFRLLEAISNGQITPDELSEEDREKVMKAQEFTRYVQRGATKFHYRGDYVEKYNPNINPEYENQYLEFLSERGELESFRRKGADI